MTQITPDRNYLSIAVITALALGLRAYGLASWDFVYDEYFTVFNAADRLTQWVNPAIYQLVYGSVTLFGFSEWAVRLPAIVLGTISIPVFYLTWRNVIGRQAALIAALIITLSLWHIWHSQYARFYAPAFLFGSLAYFYYLQALERDSNKYLAYAIGANLIGCAFHLTSALIPMACGLFSLIVINSSSAAVADYSKRVARWHLGLYLAAALLMLPFIWKAVAGWVVVYQFWGYGPLGSLLQLTKWLQIGVAASAAIGLLVMWQTNPRRGLFFAVGIGTPVAILLLASTLITVRSDYIFCSAPLVFAVAGYLCAQVQEWVSAQRGPSWAAHALTLLVLVSMLPETASHYLGRSSLHLRDVTEYVGENYRSGDAVLPLINLYNFFEHYADFEYPPEKIIGDPLDSSVAWVTEMQHFEQHPRCVWIVLPIRRRPLSAELQDWLLHSARLAWRKSARRYDYNVEGYEVFVTGQQQNQCLNRTVRLN